MKNAEEAIEKVLAGLRDADAPDGLERRILEGLEERASVQSRSGWRRLRPIWLVTPVRPVAIMSLACCVAIAGVVAVVLVVPAIRRSGHVPARSKNDVAPVESVRIAPSVAAGSDAGPSSRGRDVQRMGATNTPRTRLAGTTGSGNPVALSEMRNVSYPAPPMPLTEQERLLLRLVHKREPVELAMLDPKLRAVQDAEEKAEFQRFFGQSTTKQAAPGQSTTEQAAPQPSTTEEATPEQSTTDQTAPEQPTPEQPTQEQPAPEQSTPDKSAPDQSTTQQPTPRPTRTGDYE
jgi:hypothetical protein